MIGYILKAVANEAQAFLRSSQEWQNGQVVIETDFRRDDEKSYGMPLILIDMIDAPDMSEYIGGVTKVDWVFGMNSYNYMPDADLDDPTTYSGDLLTVIDDLRRHFSVGQWIIPPRAANTDPMSMDDLKTYYNFRFTLAGGIRANHLDQSGLVMGWRLMFTSVALDQQTDNVDLTGAPLETVQQINYPGPR